MEASLGSVTRKRTKRGTSCGGEASVRECPGKNRGLWGSQLAEGNHMQWEGGAAPSGHRRHTWHTGQTRSKSQQKSSAQLGRRGVVTRGSRDHHQRLASPAITSHNQPTSKKATSKPAQIQSGIQSRYNHEKNNR